MKVEQYIGQLEEELVKYQWTLDPFDRLYLIDKLFMLTETINREHVNKLGYVSMLHSTFVLTPTSLSDRLSRINDSGVLYNYNLTIPGLLTALNDNVVREVIASDGEEAYYLNYILPEEFDTKEDNFWTISTKSFAVVDDTTLRIGRFSSSFLSGIGSHVDDSISVRAIFKDQRELLTDPTMEDIMNIDLKVASTYRLMILFKKDIFTTIGIAQEKEDDGSRDNREQQG